MQNEEQPARSPAADVAVVLLAAAAVAAPVAMGCTGIWSRLALEAVMTVAAVVWSLSARRPTWSLVLPIAVSGLVLVQILPLPDAVLRPLSSISLATWKVARAEHPAMWGTVSIDPAATAAAARRLLLGLATIAVVADLSRSQRYRRVLLGALAVSAVVILALAILFPMDQDERKLLGLVQMKGPMEFWRTPVLPPVQTAGWAYLEWVKAGDVRYVTELRLVGDGVGPYVTSNQFAAGVYLTLPVCVAAIVFLCRNRVPPALLVVSAALLWLVAVWYVGSVARSRAGGGTLLLGGIALAAFACPAGRLRCVAGWAVLASAVFFLVFAALFLGNFSVLEHMVPQQYRVRVFEPGDAGRAIATNAALRMFLASPTLGIGLSAYGDLFPRIVGSGSVWYFTHNDYAQLLAETGLAGAAVAAGLLGLLATRLRRFLAIPATGNGILDAAPWAGLVSLVAHSLFDWNLHVPANAFLASLIAGLCLASGAASGRPRPGRIAASLPTWHAAIFVVACTSAFAVLGRDAGSEYAEYNVRLAMTPLPSGPRDDRAAPPKSTPPLAGAIAAAERMAAWDPWNARLAVAVGQGLLQAAAANAGDSPRDGVEATRSSAADEWFQKARYHRAICRGLPEAVPKPAPSTKAP